LHLEHSTGSGEPVLDRIVGVGTWGRSQ